MFESYLSNALIERFGQYIEGIDKNNLQVAAWNGEVLLETLRLKPDALDSLNLPICLKRGSIGRFHLTVPWKALGRLPIKVTLEDIDIVLEFENRTSWSKAKINAKANAEKDRRVDRLVAERHKRWQDQRGELSLRSASSSSWAAALGGYEMLEKLLRRSIENLELIVKNVHIRIEEKGTESPCKFCAGVTLDSFTIRTDHSSGHETGSIFKDMIMNGFSLYWDPMHNNNLNTNSQNKHCYIMVPISPTLKVTFRNNVSDSELAKVDIRGSLKEVKLNLNAAQIDEMSSTHTWVQALSAAMDSSIEQLQNNNIQRPIKRPTEAPCDWWKYAVASLIAGKVGNVRIPKSRRRNWLKLIELCQWQESYVKLFSRKLLISKKIQMEKDLNNKNGIPNDTTKLTNISKTLIDTLNLISVELRVMETSRSVAEIVAARTRSHILEDCANEVLLAQSTESRKECSEINSNNAEPTATSWFGGFFSTAAKAKDTTSQGTNQIKSTHTLSNEDRVQLLESLDDGEHILEVVSDSSLLGRVKLELNAVTISLHHKIGTMVESVGNQLPLLTVHMVRGSCDGVFRPCGFGIDMKMSDIDAWDGRPETSFSQVIRRAQGRKRIPFGQNSYERIDDDAEDDAPGDAISFSIVSNPLLVGKNEEGRNDVEVVAKVAPFEVVYVPSFFEEVRALLTNSDADPSIKDDSLRSDDEEPENASLRDQVQAWRQRRTSELISAFTVGGGKKKNTPDAVNSGRLIMDVHWDAPLVVLVEDYTSFSTPLVVADLGHLCVKTRRSDNGNVAQVSINKIDNVEKELEGCSLLDNDDTTSRSFSVSMDEFHDCDEFEDAEGTEIEEDSSSHDLKLKGEIFHFSLSQVCVLCGPRADEVIRSHSVTNIHQILYVDHSVSANSNKNGDDTVSSSSNAMNSIDSLEVIIDKFQVDLVGRVMANHESRNIILDATLPVLKLKLRSTTYAQLMRLKSAVSGSTSSHIGNKQPYQRNIKERTDTGTTIYEEDSEEDSQDQVLKSSSMVVNFKVVDMILDVSTEVPHSIANITSNDVCATSWKPKSVALLHASLQMFRGTYCSSNNVEGSESLLTIAMTSLDVLDRYQQAGKSFENMITSTRPAHINAPRVRTGSVGESVEQEQVIMMLDTDDDEDDNDDDDEKEDLVTLSMKTTENQSTTELGLSSIYVEWNPDTLVAIHDFLRLNQSDKTEETTVSDDGGKREPIHTIENMENEIQVVNERDVSVSVFMRSVSFCFNKETMRASCHLAVARIDDASFNYEKINIPRFITSEEKLNSKVLMVGDMRIRGKLGNLLLSDVSTPNTLYPDILGLQRNGDNQKESLFEFSYCAFNPERAQSSLGFGNAISLKLSPVRLVYIQQYWLELWDFIFQAVLSPAVLGAGSSGQVNDKPKSEWEPPFEYGDCIHRRKIEIEFVSPVLVLPIHPLSPTHLECDLGTWTLNNSYVWINFQTGDVFDMVSDSEALAMDVHQFEISIDRLNIASVDALPFLSTSRPPSPIPKATSNDSDDNDTTDLYQSFVNGLQRQESSEDNFFDALDAFDQLDSFANLEEENEQEGLELTSHSRSNSNSSNNNTYKSLIMTKRVKTLLKSCVGLTAKVTWPADGRPSMPQGRSHQIICEVQLSDIRLELRHADYFLFRRFLDHNIGAVARIPPTEIGILSDHVQYSPSWFFDMLKKEIGFTNMNNNTAPSVAYSYDEVGTPTTYSVSVTLDQIEVMFVTNEKDKVTSLNCNQFSYQLKQTPYMMGVIGETEVVCGSINLTDRRSYRPPRAFNSLLRPLSHGDNTSSLDNTPTLLYKSRTQLIEGVAHEVVINEACFVHLPGAFGDFSNFVSYTALEEDCIAAIFVACRAPRLPLSSKDILSAGEKFLHRVTKPQVGPSFSFTIDVLRPHYVLLVDADDPNSLGLVLNCDACFKYETKDPARLETQLSGSLSNLSACFCVAAHPTKRSGHILLQPSTIVLNTFSKLNNDGKSPECFAAVKTTEVFSDEMDIKFNVSDVALCLRIMDDFNSKEKLIQFNISYGQPMMTSNEELNSIHIPKNQIRTCLDIHSKMIHFELMNDSGTTVVELVQFVWLDISYKTDNGHKELLPIVNKQSNQDDIERIKPLTYPDGKWTCIEVRDMIVLDMSAPESFRKVFGTSISNTHVSSADQRNQAVGSPPPFLKELTRFEMIDRQSGLRQIKWDFNVIEVAWHPAFVARIHACLRTLRPETVAPSPTTQLPVKLPPSHSCLDNESVKFAIVLDVNVKVSALVLRLDKEKEERSLLSFTMENTCCRFRRSKQILDVEKNTINDQSEVAEQGTWIEGEIGCLEVEDVCSKDTMYRHMISTHKSAPSLARFSYRSANMSNSEKQSDCNLISLSLSSMRFVYLQQFWLEIVDYVNEGILGDAVNGSLRTAGDWVAEQAVVSKTAIQVDLSAPSILVPEHCSSARALDASLSTFLVSTHFETRDMRIFREEDSIQVVESLWFRSFKINIGGIDLNSIEGAVIDTARNSLSSSIDSELSRVPLTTAPVNLNLNVSMPLDGKYALVLRTREVEGLGLVVTGDISPIVIRLDEHRFVLLKAVVAGNFNDQTQHGRSTQQAGSNIPHVDDEVEFNYGNEDAPVNDIQVKLCVAQAGVQISFLKPNARQAHEFGEGGRACLELIMRSVVVSYHRETNLFTSFDVALQSCSLNDLRPNRVVRHLISPRVQSNGTVLNESPQLVFHMANRLSDGKVGDIILNGLSVNIAYDPLICFYAFLQSTSTSANKQTSSSLIVDTGNDVAPILAPTNLKMKLLLHNPLICFWEDEQSETSRVLSLKGLVVIDISKRYDEKKLERCSVRVDHLESFMLEAKNSNIHKDEIEDDGFEDALDEEDHPSNSPYPKTPLLSRASSSMDDVIYTPSHEPPGTVTLLEPVSMQIIMERSSEPLHPTKRNIDLSLEPISIRFSKENCVLLSSIANSWSKALKSTLKEVNIEGSDKDEPHDMREVPNCEPKMSATSSPPPSPSKRATSSSSSSLSCYLVEFPHVKLGLTLQRLRGSQLAFVESMNSNAVISPLIDSVEYVGYDDDLDLPMKNNPDIGDIIVAVGDDSVTRNSYDTTIQMIITSPRPVRITFRSTQSSNDIEESSNRTSTSFLSSASSIVPGGYFIKVDAGRRVPEECSPNEIDTFVLNRTSLDGLELTKGGDGEMLVVRNTAAYAAYHAPVQPGGASSPYTKRLPRPGSVLIAVDGVSVEGIGFDKCVRMLQDGSPILSQAKSFSHTDSKTKQSRSPSQRDQFSRRAAPSAVLVLRWREVTNWPNKDSASITCAGLEALLVDDEKSRAAPLLRIGLGTATVRTDFGFGLTWRWLSLPARAKGIRLVGVSNALSLDAFNRHVGEFEPLVEPSDLRLEVEAELRNVTNYDIKENINVQEEIVKEVWKVGDSITRVSASGDVNVNITESFIETLKAVHTSWTQRKQHQSSEEKETLASLTSPKQLPFMFHNLTGHHVTFVLKRTITGSASEHLVQKVKRRCVGAGVSLPFALEPDERNQPSPSTNHIHTGPIHHASEVLPLLSVEFDDGLFAPVVGLSMSAVGKRLCSTVLLPHATSVAASKPITSRVPMVWEVCLLEGQHHLSLRSALSLENNMGVPLYLAALLPFKPIANDSKNEVTDWRSSIDAGSTLSLPLGVALSETIRLRMDDYNWCELSIFKPSESQVVIPDPARVRSFVLCRDTSNCDGQRAEAHTAAVFLSSSPSSPDCLSQTSGSYRSTNLNKSVKNGKQAEQPLMIHCHPGAALRSLLPEELIWSLRTTSSQASTSSSASKRSIAFLGGGVLQAGEKAWLPTVRDISRAEVQVKLTSYQWSSWTAVKKKGGVFRLLLKDASGGVITISAELNIQPGHAPTLTFSSDFWLRNLSSLPITYGCTSFPPRHNKSSDSMFVEHGGCKGLALGYGGCETRVFTVTAQPNEMSGDAGSVTLEMFQCAVVKRDIFSTAPEGFDTCWCDCAGGEIDPASFGEALPSTEWAWANNWTLDEAGATLKDPLDAQGWESSTSGRFFSSTEGPRKFCATDKYWRRRWTRIRTKRNSKEQELLNGKEVHNVLDNYSIFQLPKKWRSDGISHHDETAKLVIKVKDSRWSDVIEIATTTDGGGGAVDIVGGRWLVSDAPQYMKSKTKGRKEDTSPPRSRSSSSSQSLSSSSSSSAAAAASSLSSKNMPRSRCPIPLYKLAYSVITAPEPWHKSRIVVIRDRYRIVNRGNRNLRFKQCGDDDASAVTLKPGEGSPLHWTSLTLPELLVISFPSEENEIAGTYHTKDWLWSGGIDPLQVGSYSANVRPAPIMTRRGDSMVLGGANTRYRTVRVHTALGAAVTLENLNEQHGNGAVVVSFEEEEGSDELPQPVLGPLPIPGKEPLVRIENFTQWPVFYAQSGVPLAPHPSLVNTGEVTPKNRSGYSQSGTGAHACDVLPPRTRSVFGWDIPCPVAARKLQLLGLRLSLAPLASGDGTSKTKETIVKLLVGTTMSLNAVKSPQGRIGPVAIAVLTEGLTTVVRILSYGSPNTLPPLSFSRKEGKHANVGGNTTEVIQRKVKIYMFVNCLKVNLLVHGNDKKPRDGSYHPREVLLGSLHTMFMDLELSTPQGNSTFALSIGGAQIDNHLPNAPYPVLLSHQAEINSMPSSDDKPLLALSLSLLNRSSNLIHIKHLNFLLSKRMILCIDESVVQCLLALIDRLSVSLAVIPPHESAQWKLPACCLPSLELSRSSASSSSLTNSVKLRSRVILVELAYIHPIKLALSLQKARETSADVYVGWRPSKLIMDMLRCESAHISLDAFQIEGSRLSLSELRHAIFNHYSASVRRQLFAALGSLAAIGDPVGLVRGFAKGATDAFSEPLGGLARAAEGGDFNEVRKGFARGAASFTNKTVGGVANSAGLITSSISTAGSSLAFDKEYKLRRAEKQAEKASRPHQGLLGGLGTAGTSMADGVLGGIAGLMTAPVKGYAHGGLKGAVHGAGKGAVGLLVKPVVGISDAATDVLQGIQGSTAPRNMARFSPPSIAPSLSSASSSELVSIAAPGQVRPRRALYGMGRLIRPFSIEDAYAAHLLSQVCGTNLHVSEEYSDHVDLGHYILLLSTLKLCIVDDHGSLHLLVYLKDIACCEKVDEGILLHLFDPVAVVRSQHQKGYGANETLMRFIKCGNQVLLVEMDERIQQALRTLSS